MSKINLFVVFFVFLVSPATAADSRPSEQSVKKLLAVTEARKLLDSTTSQIDGMMQHAIQQSLRDQTVTPQQRKAIENMRTKTAALLKKELSWDSIEPLYIRVYRDTFTQEEINGMLVFYQTPSGQALIKKMPVAMQNSMIEMQKRMAPLMEKLQQIQQDTFNELKQPNK